MTTVVGGSNRHRVFPVVDDEGRLLGTVDLPHLIGVPWYERAMRSIGAVTTPLAESGVALPDAPATTVLTALTARTPFVVVTDDAHRVVGLVSAADITRAVELAAFRRTPGEATAPT